jgi:hypothetical protein
MKFQPEFPHKRCPAKASNSFSGPATQLLVVAASAVWIGAGGSPLVLALLLSATSLLLVLIVLDAEKRRNAALHATLDRLSRELVVKALGQD